MHDIISIVKIKWNKYYQINIYNKFIFTKSKVKWMKNWENNRKKGEKIDNIV